MRRARPAFLRMLPAGGTATRAALACLAVAAALVCFAAGAAQANPPGTGGMPSPTSPGGIVVGDGAGASGVGTASSESAGAAARNASMAVQPLVFLPADQVAHPKYGNEWWYTIGHVTAAGGREFGFEVSMNRLSLSPLPGSIYRADLAVTDVTAQAFHQNVGLFLTATESTNLLDVRVGTASLIGISPQNMHLKATLPDGTAVYLQLSSRKRPMAVGGTGFIPLGDGSSYYYSMTNVAAKGTVTVNGQTLNVKGFAWHDHQWGNWAWGSISSWTWMAVQLNNGVQMNLGDIKGAGGNANILNRKGNLSIADDLTITPLDVWVSPHTGIAYASGWLLQIPSRKCRLKVIPLVRDQELDMRIWNTDFAYWEGACSVTGKWQGKPVKGRTYTELISVTD